MTNNDDFRVSWEVSLARFTGFVNPIDQMVDGEFWWEECIKTTPEKINVQPQKEEKQIEGQYGEGWLILKQHATRLDWLYVINSDAQFDSKTLLTLGKFDPITKEFFQLVSNWTDIDNFPILERIALGLILVEPVENGMEGFSKLEKFLHSVDIDPENSRDFLYQINRRRLSNVYEGMEINRLSKWSVGSFKSSHLQVKLGEKRDQAHVMSHGEWETFTRLELDINTDQNNKGEFDGEISVKLFQEILELAKEISVKGDVA